MAHNSRFAVGVHIMTLIAWLEGEPAKSDYIARSAATNPVVVRRLLGALAKAGLVTSQAGPSGGSCLTRDAASITLLDIYRAVDEGRLFDLHHQPPSASCPVGKDIQPALRGIFDRAEGALQAELEMMTLAEMIAAVRAPSRDLYRQWLAEGRLARPHTLSTHGSIQ